MRRVVTLGSVWVYDGPQLASLCCVCDAATLLGPASLFNDECCPRGSPTHPPKGTHDDYTTHPVDPTTHETPMSQQATQFDPQEVLAFTVDLAKQAGAVIRRGRQELRDEIAADFESIVKKNSSDLVTKTDQGTEAFCHETIRKKYPGWKIIGEESWAAGKQDTLDDTPTFIIDPIDGTTNFVHNFPFSCISIGFWAGSKQVLGVVYAPFLDRLYTGLVGHGSHLITPATGDRPGEPQRLPLQKPLPLPSLRQALIALEWGSDRRHEVVSRKAKTMERLASEGGNMVRGIRSIGSAALSCCFVAEGSMDLYHEIACWSWDIAAGFAIINEAGGLTVGSKADTLAKITDSASTPALGTVTPDILQGRKYCVVRAADRADQVKLLGEFFEAIDEWEAA
ncbi:unnamed protein product [Parajaminaea phylloscopi]